LVQMESFAVPNLNAQAACDEPRNKTIMAQDANPGSDVLSKVHSLQHRDRTLEKLGSLVYYIIRLVDLNCVSASGE
jgi:hypothetical protein